MNNYEKIVYLQKNHWKEWILTRDKVETELSNAQSVLCVCGKLATGLHEKICRKFNKRVEALTVQRLKHLINYLESK